MAEFATEEEQAKVSGKGPLAERARKLQLRVGREKARQTYEAETRLPGGGFGTKSGQLKD